tara:strand:- start:244 stop:471 length:228 start_codon:yes stop_codon:yes gene_type:complete
MLDLDEQLVRIGSLVMWNREHSEDFGCVGIVVHHYFERQEFDQPITEFLVLWADNDRCEYDYGDLWRKHIKVVKF